MSTTIKQGDGSVATFEGEPEPALRWTAGLSLGHQLGEGFSIVREVAPNCGQLELVGVANTGKHGKPDDEARANAVLWSAAPEMAAALQNLLGVIQYIYETGDIRDSQRNDADAIENARAALRKAGAI